MFELFIIYKFYIISGSNRYVYLYMEKTERMGIRLQNWIYLLVWSM